MKLRVTLALCCSLTAFEAAGQDVLYYHHDATGNRVAMTDETGQVVWEADLKPFGNGTPQPQTAPLRMLGQEQEAGTTAEGGLYQLGVRYFDPFLGRFISPDPLLLEQIDPQNPQRFNLYSYALNNPYLYHDASGLAPEKSTFHKPHQAALQALKDIFAQAFVEGIEYGGIIYQNEDGTYSYSAPRTDSYTSTVDPWPDDGPVPGKPVAYYHTHPRGLRFSDNDLIYSDEHRIDAFVATPDGHMHFYQRGTDRDSVQRTFKAFESILKPLVFVGPPAPPAPEAGTPGSVRRDSPSDTPRP